MVSRLTSLTGQSGEIISTRLDTTQGFRISNSGSVNTNPNHHIWYLPIWWGILRIEFFFIDGFTQVRAYSLDFRQKIIDIYESESISQRRLAKRFGVALSFIQKLLKQYQETGSIAPKVRTQQTPTKLNDEQLAVLKHLIEANNDATLAELQALLEAETGVRIGCSTVDRMLKQKLDVTVKKRPSTRMRKQRNASRKNG